MSRLTQFFYRQVSPWNLAGLRIGTGLLLIAKMTGISSVLTGGKVVLGRPVSLFANAEAYRLASGFQLPYPGLDWLPVPSFAGFGLIETFLFVLAIAWTIGLLTRLTGPLLFLGTVYLFGLSQFFYSHSMFLFILTLGVLARAPTAQQRSVDKLVLGYKKTPVSIYPLRLLQILVSVIYISVGVQRLLAGRTDGAALSIIESFSTSPEILQTVINLTGGHSSFAWISSILIIVFGLAIWHRKLRRGVVVLGILVHIFASLVLDMGTFHYQMIVLYLAFFACAPKQCAINFGQMQQQ